ncbi:MAG: MFS transporter [Acidobacteria bacterium]|nr:MFS transporter [Acidobacteriota bacterium]
MAADIDVGRLIDDSRLNRVSVSVILLCGLVMLMDGYDYTIITVAAPVIMKEWGVGPGAFSWAFSAAFFGYLFGAVGFGVLSDRIGRKRTLMLASCVFSTGTLLVYFSHSLESLIAIRVFTGIGIGGAVPCAITLTSEYSPLKGRGKYVSVMYSGFLVGIVLGGYLAGFMLERLGWRPLFLVGFFAPLAAIVLVGLKLPESARWLAARPQGERERRTLSRLVAKIRPGVVLTGEARFVSAGSGGARGALRELFAGRLRWVTPALWAYYLVSSIAVFFIGSWSPQLLVLKGFGASTAAYITGSINVLVAAGCLLSGFYFDRFGFRSGAWLHAVAAAAVLVTGGMQSAGFVLLLMASAFFINSAHMAVTILAPIVYPPGCRNKGAGAAVAAGRIGAILGPPIGGYLLDTSLPMETLLGVAAIPLAAAALLCWLAGRQYDFHFAPLYSRKPPSDGA